MNAIRMHRWMYVMLLVISLAMMPNIAETNSDRKIGTTITLTLADGTFRKTMTFGGTKVFGSKIVHSLGGSDVLVAKMSANGSYQWVSTAGGVSNDGVENIVALSDGSAVIRGYFRGVAIFGNTTLKSVGSVDMFVAKVNQYGQWLWAIQAPRTTVKHLYMMPDKQELFGLSDGSVIVSGDFKKTIHIGGYTLSQSCISGVCEQSRYIARIRPNGSWQWVIKSQISAINGLSKVSPDGMFIVLGEYGYGNEHSGPKIHTGETTYLAFETASAQFDGVTLKYTFRCPKVVEFFSVDFVAQMNKDGKWIWARNGNIVSALCNERL